MTGINRWGAKAEPPVSSRVSGGFAGCWPIQTPEARPGLMPLSPGGDDGLAVATRTPSSN